MREIDSRFVGDIPGNYDTCLGPNIFDHFAQALAGRVAHLAPDNLLELAAGSGIVTRHLRDKLPGAVPLTATDLNEPMLDVGRAKFDTDGENVTFRQADAQALPFADASFDLVACQFGVMFFPDRVASYREAARVLRPGGRYLFSTWGHMRDNPFSEITHRVFAEIFEGDPPVFYQTPFCCGDPDRVIDELRAAGLGNVRHTVQTHEREVPDYTAFAHGLVFGNPAIDEVLERGGDPAFARETIAGRMREVFGDEPSAMPLLSHLFEVRVS